MAGEAPASPSNVISNPIDAELGDIAISYDTCKREAEAAQILLEYHLTHLLIHSCLHLLGYDHETVADAGRMENLEIKLLETLGIANTY